MLLFIGVFGFFGIRKLNDDNIHGYDEATPEQRKAFIESSRRGFTPPPSTSPNGQ